jgi:FkbM family methyltransferase
VKQLIQNTVGRLGYELRRKRPAFRPFIEEVSLAGVTFQFWVGDPIGIQWYNPEGHRRAAEPRETARLLRPGDRVLDIGAHHGFEAMLFSKLVGPQGFVLSVEPFPFNAMLAWAQVGLNRADNCEILQAAVGARSGELCISPETDSRVLKSGLTVPAFTVDELSSKYGPFTAVKIDVEGFEYEVLKGATEFLASRPKILLELHAELLPLYGSSVEQVLAMLPSYEGTFMPRVGDWTAVSPYPAEKIPTDVNMNLFLTHSEIGG